MYFVYVASIMYVNCFVFHFMFGNFILFTHFNRSSICIVLRRMHTESIKYIHALDVQIWLQFCDNDCNQVGNGKHLKTVFA